MSRSILHRPAALAAALACLFTAALFASLTGSASAASEIMPVLGEIPGPTGLDPTGADSSTVMTPSTFIDICSQHAPKCPLDEAEWPGAPGEWQYTAKRWVKHSGTPPGRQVIWEWSMPYSGTNPAYTGHRENHYADFSSEPAGSPDFSTSNDPYTYDWERWIIEPNNLRWMELGGSTDTASLLVGETDCTSGAYYPVIDHTVPWAYTDIYSTQRTENCGGGGYVLTLLTESWGAPLSEERVVQCDDPRTGIPASESARGNAVCKVSPYVGKVEQRYVFGPVPGLAAGAGCEVVIYAWGWNPKPTGTTSGQDYEAYFRNGELRFSRWYNLSGDLGGVIPDAFDDNWWAPRCDLAWMGITNAVYSGIFKIGQTVYTDSVTLPGPTVITLTTAGGVVANSQGQVTVTFPANSFTETVTLTLAVDSAAMSRASGSAGESRNLAAYPLAGVGRAFTMTATAAATGEARQPVIPYTISVGYPDYTLGLIAESTLGLYAWSGSAWVRQPSSQVAAQSNRVSATLDRMGRFALLGQPERIFVPSILK